MKRAALIRELAKHALAKWLIHGIIAGSLVLLGLGLLWSALRRGKEFREAAAGALSEQNLKEMFLALKEYTRVTGRYPPAALCDAAGKPLLS